MGAARPAGTILRQGQDGGDIDSGARNGRTGPGGELRIERAGPGQGGGNLCIRRRQRQQACALISGPPGRIGTMAGKQRQRGFDREGGSNVSGLSFIRVRNILRARPSNPSTALAVVSIWAAISAMDWPSP